MAVGYGELPVRRKAGLQFWVSMLVELCLADRSLIRPPEI